MKNYPSYFDLKMIPLNQLTIDETYQRGIQRNSKLIAENFDPYAAQAICVAHRKNGILMVVDGRQRYEAALLCGYKNILCLVFKSTGPKHEALIFSRLNGFARKSVTPMQNFIALREAEDHATLKIINTVEKLGYVINYSQKSNRQWPMINTVRCLQRIYKEGGVGGLELTLDQIKRNWQYDADALQESFILGFWMFLSVMNDYKKIKEKLKGRTPREYIMDARRIEGSGFDRYKLIKSELLNEYYKD